MSGRGTPARPRAGWPVAACRFAAALATIALAVVASAAGPGGVSVRFLAEPVIANEYGSWQLAILIANRHSAGAYGDSLILVVHPAEGTASASPPVTMKLLLPPSASAISAGDSLETMIQVVASSRTARLEVRFYSHDETGSPSVASASARAAGNVLEERYPARVARVGGRDVEMVRVPATEEAASGAGVLLLPGEGFDAVDLLVPAHRLAQLGITTVIVGAPGRGRSTGPDDFAGRASLAAALAGLDSLAHQPGVDRGQLAVWGISRGGTLALLLALERPTALRAVVAQSASYDLWATHRATAPADRPAFEAAAGRDSAGWRERSPLLRAGSIKPAILVLHGELDSVCPPGPAHAFVQTATAAGANVTGRFLPRAGHVLPPLEAGRFLQLQLAPHH